MQGGNWNPCLLRVKMEELMTIDYDIIKKITKKAFENGWDGELIGWRYNPDDMWEKYDNSEMDQWHLNDLVFDHNFAKALWGEKNGSPCLKSAPHGKCEGWHEEGRPKSEGYYPRWQFHLERMVLANDIIRYLEKYE
jgi:hypothetical protein